MSDLPSAPTYLALPPYLPPWLYNWCILFVRLNRLWGLTLPSSSTVMTPSLSQSKSLKASFKQSMSSLESCLSGLSLSVFLVIVWQCEHHKMTRCVLTTRLTCSKLTASRGKSPDPGTHSDTLPLPNIDNIKLVSRYYGQKWKLFKLFMSDIAGG